MKSLQVKSALIASFIAYTLGVSAFLGSFFVPLMSDPEVQANLVLAIAIVPAALLGARFYYRKGHSTSGFVLGAAMFFVTMILDALITVPLFVLPAGGDHLSFFTDPGFWFIGLEYVLTVAIYRRVTKAAHSKRAERTSNG
ncbi:MAG: DUF5367 family protein [Bacteroidota bacterium]